MGQLPEIAETTWGSNEKSPYKARREKRSSNRKMSRKESHSARISNILIVAYVITP